MKEFERDIKELARLKLPISFLATQWESVLTYNKSFLTLPRQQNPNTIGLDGKIKQRSARSAPRALEAGRQDLDDNLFIKKIQEWYPDPPLVIFISTTNIPAAMERGGEVKSYLGQVGRRQIGRVQNAR